MSLDDSPKLKVRDVMTTRVVTVKENQTRQQAARLLSQYHISGLPVVNDENMVVGVVTEYDIISKEERIVSDIMTRSVISVGEDTDLEEVRRILVHERIKRLLVLDQGRLIGIVSRADLVRAVATRWICYVCGEIMQSEEKPDACPRCGAREVAALYEAASPGS